MQKILPRIQGSNNQIREMLCALFKFCAGDYSGYDTNNDGIVNAADTAADETIANSAQKF